jgi:hypothetical protein
VEGVADSPPDGQQQDSTGLPSSGPSGVSGSLSAVSCWLSADSPGFLPGPAGEAVPAIATFVPVAGDGAAAGNASTFDKTVGEVAVRAIA